MNRRTGIVLLVLAGMCASLGALTIVEPGWSVDRTDTFANGGAAHYNPVDGRLYVVRRGTGAQDGLWRIELSGDATFIVAADRAAALVIDNNGNMFVSEDYDGVIYRTDYGATTSSLWVNGFHTNDDDPVGMAIAPDDYSGSVLSPGQALVVDRGASGLDEVWGFDPDVAQGEWAVHSDNGTLIDALDITINSTSVYLVDGAGASNGVIYELGAGGTLTALTTSEAIAEPSGITFDPLTGDLFVLDSGGQRVVRVNTTTGNVSDVVTDLVLSSPDWAGIDTTPSGDKLIITDRGAGTIITLVVPEPASLGLLALGMLALVALRKRMK